MNNRRHWIAPPTILSLLLIGVLVWGYREYDTRTRYEIALDNHYQRLFYDVKKTCRKCSSRIIKGFSSFFKGKKYTFIFSNNE